MSWGGLIRELVVRVSMQATGTDRVVREANTAKDAWIEVASRIAATGAALYTLRYVARGVWNVLIGGAVEFQDAIRQADTASGLFGEKLVELDNKQRERAFRISSLLGESPISVARSFFEVMQAGISATKPGFDELVESAVKLSHLAPGVGSPGKTAEAITIFARQFGVDTSKPGEMKRVAGAMLLGNILFPGSLKGIQEALGYSGAMLSATGQSMEEAVVLAGMTMGGGIPNSRAGTSIRTSVGRMFAEPNALEALATLGIDPYDKDKKFRSVLDVLEETARALSTRPDKERATLLRDFGGVRTMEWWSYMTKLSPEALEHVSDSLKLMREKEGVFLDLVWQARIQTFSEQMRLLGNNLKIMFLYRVFSPLVAGLTPVVKALDMFAFWINKIIEESPGTKFTLGVLGVAGGVLGGGAVLVTLVVLLHKFLTWIVSGAGLLLAGTRFFAPLRALAFRLFTGGVVSGAPALASGIMLLVGRFFLLAGAALLLYQAFRELDWFLTGERRTVIYEKLKEHYPKIAEMFGQTDVKKIEDFRGTLLGAWAAPTGTFDQKFMSDIGRIFGKHEVTVKIEGIPQTPEGVAVTKSIEKGLVQGILDAIMPPRSDSGGAVIPHGPAPAGGAVIPHGPAPAGGSVSP